MTAWIVEHADGSLTQHASAPGTAGIDPGRRWAAMPRLLVSDGTERWDWSARAIVEDAARVETRLIALVKAEAERRKMEHASAGGYKKAEYAAKEREVAAWDALGATAGAILVAFMALAPAARAARFPYAVASAASFRDTPAAAIDRFRAGIARAAPIPRIAGVEEAACNAIRAARTAAAKRAAYAAIIWN